MKVKFKKIERIAGVFVLAAIFGAVVLMGLAAVKKGWLQRRVHFKTQVLSAEGIRPGTPVTISGLRAGEITDIELLSADNIVVHFDIYDKFHKQVRSDSRVQIVRPFVIGDKTMEVTVGSQDLDVLVPDSLIESEVAFDMLDLLSGKRIGPFLGTLEGLMQNLSILAKAFADPKRTHAFVKMFDRMDPLILNLNKMSLEVTKFSSEFNQILPQIREESPEFGRQLSQLLQQLNTLSATVTPAFQAVGPELPHASRRAVEALNEMVITLKAIQKSFLLSGKVKDVKEEEREKERRPTGE